MWHFHRPVNCAGERPVLQADARIPLRGPRGSLHDHVTAFDAATVVEVIELLDAPLLAAFGKVVYECARPRRMIVTPEKIEYTVRFETAPGGTLRN